MGDAPMLRGCTKKKDSGASAVLVKERLKQRVPAALGPQAETEKIPGYLFPSTRRGRDIFQVVKLSQKWMGTPKSQHNHGQPAGDQPGGQQAVRVNGYRSAIEAFLPHLPASDAQEQGSYHSVQGVVKVRDQLDRQERKGSTPFMAEKSGNRNAFFLKLWEQLNGISPI